MLKPTSSAQARPQTIARATPTSSGCARVGAGRSLTTDGRSRRGRCGRGPQTENKKGIANRGEALPQMIDPQYVVGFTWERIPSVRVTKSFGDKFTFGVSAENPQTTIGGRGFDGVTTSVPGGAAATTSQNFFFNAPGNSAGLYNAFDPTGYTVNKIPDFVIKAAFDPGWGHYEILGIVSEFRDRIYPCAVVSIAASSTDGTVILTGTGGPINPAQCVSGGNPITAPSAFGAFNDSKTGGGFGVSAS